MAYARWTHAREYLDVVGYTQDDGELDVDRMQGFITLEERRLDNELRRFYDVPVSETNSPELFSQARDIVAQRSAAKYIRWARQVEGAADRTWWADELDKQTEETVRALTVGRMQPGDAEEAASPMQFVPYDGKDSSDTTPDPLFTRDNIVSGSGHW